MLAQPKEKTPAEPNNSRSRLEVYTAPRDMERPPLGGPDQSETPSDFTARISRTYNEGVPEMTLAYHTQLSCRQCERRHRTFRSQAKCRWPKATFIHGEGPWAFVATCGTPSISLWKTEAEALSAKARINAWGCGSWCSGSHRIVDLRG